MPSKKTDDIDESVIDMAEMDGIFKEAKEIQPNSQEISFIYGFTHNGINYFANLVVSDPEDLVNAVDYIKESTLITLNRIGIIHTEE